MRKKILLCAGWLFSASLMFTPITKVKAEENIVYTTGQKKYISYGESSRAHYGYEDFTLKTSDSIVRVTVNGKEQEIVENKKEYTFRVIGEQQYTDKTITPNGKYVICCYTGDGKTLAAKKIVVMDRDSPYLTHVEKNIDMGNNTATYINKSVTIKPLDDTSNIVNFTVNGKKASIKNGYTLRKKGKYVFKAKDNAGNVGGQTVYFKMKKILSPTINGKETKISLKKCKLDEWNVYNPQTKKWKKNTPVVFNGMSKYNKKTTEEMNKQAEEFYKNFSFQVKGDQWLNKDGSLKWKDPISANLARINAFGKEKKWGGVGTVLGNCIKYNEPDKNGKTKKILLKTNIKKNNKIYNLGERMGGAHATVKNGQNVLHFAHPKGIIKIALVSYRNLSGEESYYDYYDRSKNNVRIFTFKKPLKNFSITLEKQGYYTFYFYTKDMLKDINDTYSKNYISFHYIYLKDKPQAKGYESNMIRTIASLQSLDEGYGHDGGVQCKAGVAKMCRSFDLSSPYTTRIYRNNELYKDFNGAVDDEWETFYYPKDVTTDDIWTFVVKDICGNITIYKNIRVERKVSQKGTTPMTKTNDINDIP